MRMLTFAAASRLAPRRRTSVLMAVVLAVGLCLGASSALAANLSGDGTLIGTSGNDNLTAKNAAGDAIWGLGGNDTLNAGNGSKDVIDGGGACPAGLGSGVYSKLPAGDYCQHGPVAPCGVDNISVGSGSGDVIYGNCGQNSIAGNGGSYTVYGYGTSDNITLSGNGSDVVYAYAPGNVNVGNGTNIVFDNYGAQNTVNCGSKKTTVYATSGNKTGVSSACTLVLTSQQAPPSEPHARANTKQSTAKAQPAQKATKQQNSRKAV
jgi:hypothetical protein